MLACPASPPSMGGDGPASGGLHLPADAVDATGKLPQTPLSIGEQPGGPLQAVDPFLMDTLASTSAHGMQTFFDALRRTSSVGNLPPSVGSTEPEDDPPGILNTIADQGSTAWMGMPEDVLSYAPTEQRARKKAGRSKPSSGPARATSLPAPSSSSSSQPARDRASVGAASIDYHEQLADLRSELYVRGPATACRACTPTACVLC